MYLNELAHKTVNSFDVGVNKTMIVDILLEKLIDKSLERIRKALVNTDFKFAANRTEIETSLTQHQLAIQQWASTISFKDLSNSRITSNVYVNLNLYVYSRRIRISENEIVPQIPIEDIFSKDTHIVLLGQPGAGKTTSMKYFCHRILFDDTFYPKRFSFPILIKLRELRSEEGNEGIVFNYIFNLLGLRLDLPSGFNAGSQVDREEYFWLRRKLVIEVVESFGVLLILDGFDETQNEVKESVLRDIRHLSDHLHKSTLILTSRTGSFSYHIDQTRQYEISPLESPQIEDFARKWLGDETKTDIFIEKVTKSPFADTAIRPLTLAHLCAIFERVGDIPPKPKTIYKKVINMLLEEWDEQRLVKRKSQYANFEVDRKFDFLCNLAFHFTSARKVVFTKQDLLSAYNQIYFNFDLSKKEAGSVVDELESHTGLFIQSGYETFEFAHKSIQEYLTAEYLVRLPAIPTELERLLLLPEELAIVVTISSNSSEYLIQLITTRLLKVNTGRKFLKSFFNRLLTENPDFEPNFNVFLWTAALYSHSIGDREKFLDPSYVRKGHVSRDMVLEEYKGLLELLLSRTNDASVLMRNVDSYYSFATQSKVEANSITVLTKRDSIVANGLSAELLFKRAPDVLIIPTSYYRPLGSAIGDS